MADRSRALGWSAFVTLSLLALAPIGCTSSGSDRTESRPSASTIATTTTDPSSTERAVATSAADPSSTTAGPTDPPTSRQRAVVVSVTDGDTFDATVDGRPERVRLIGIDTPERGDCLHAEATHSLATLLAAGDVDLQIDTTDRDRYGRLLRYVWIGDTFVNEAQVSSGYAVARRYEPDVTQAERLEAAEVAATAAGFGRWKLDPCGPPVTGLDGSAPQVRIDHIEFDAPGDDSANLNGEWVTIVNDATAPISLGGWELRDESVSHRYRFAAIVMAPKASITISSGCGTDTDQQLFWCNGVSAVWNNDGDTAFLIDSSGNVVTSLAY